MLIRFIGQAGFNKAPGCFENIVRAMEARERRLASWPEGIFESWDCPRLTEEEQCQSIATEVLGLNAKSSETNAP